MGIKLLTVLGLSGVELWAGVPAGFAFQLHPLIIFLTTSAGAILGVLLVIILGEEVRRRLLRRFQRREKEGRQGRLRAIWERYGLVGLGLSAPLFFGAPLGTALGLMLGAKAAPLLFWMGLGVVLWSLALTLVGWLGITGLVLIGL